MSSDAHKRELTRQILNDANIISLAIADADGPWCSQVGFWSDEQFNIYWVSSLDTRHSRAIQQNSHIAAAILAEHGIGKERALQLEGNARRIDEPRLDLEQKLREKLGKEPVQEETYFARGFRWYQLTPSRLFLLHHEFGYDRQQVV